MAADEAYRNYRDHVSEYTDEKTPEVSMHGNDVAFRPALTELEENQIDVLSDGLSGFVERDELAKWERRVQEATFGEYATTAEHPVAQSPRGRPYQTLCGNAGDETPTRYLYLLESVMPACIGGARILREKAEEKVEEMNNGLPDEQA